MRLESNWSFVLLCIGFFMSIKQSGLLDLLKEVCFVFPSKKKFLNFRFLGNYTSFRIGSCSH